MRQSAEVIHIPQAPHPARCGTNTTLHTSPSPRPLLRNEPPREGTDFAGNPIRSPTCYAGSPTRCIKSATRHNGQPIRLHCPPHRPTDHGFSMFRNYTRLKNVAFLFGFFTSQNAVISLLYFPLCIPGKLYKSQARLFRKQDKSNHRKRAYACHNDRHTPYESVFSLPVSRSGIHRHQELLVVPCSLHPTFQIRHGFERGHVRDVFPQHPHTVERLGILQEVVAAGG